MDKEDIKWLIALFVNAFLVIWAAFRTPTKVININKYYYLKPKRKKPRNRKRRPKQKR